ncbi:hypothetical protein [Pseudomonas sp. AE27]|uniref:hypothetical protein n=1 Tax=Pseudomonas sp. AE27 TaxID=3127460 RepID=UPI0030CBD11A
MFPTRDYTIVGDYPGAPEDAPVWFSHKLVRELSILAQDIPSVIPVMLAMTAGVVDGHAVEITQAEVALRCNVTIQEVRRAVGKLSRAGLISDVEMSAEPQGMISCLMGLGYDLCMRG